MIESPTGKVPVVIVAGMSKKTRAIGKENELLWHVPADLKRFKQLSMGHPVIMGRKTFESIVAIIGKPLPGRTNIVVTRQSDYHHEGAVVAGSLEEAFKVALSENPTEIHIGGGEEMYRQALPYVDRLYLTFFFDEKEGDTHFPAFEEEFEIAHEHPPQEHAGVTFQWVDFVRTST